MLSKLMLFSALGMIMEISVFNISAHVTTIISYYYSQYFMQNDAVYASVLSIDWNRLNISHMRKMTYLTQMAQNAIPLKAGVVDLDMNLFVEVHE